jgi:beta-galactosidase
VDFDSGEVKSLKGFIYQPRADGGNNGDIKDYTIQVSRDGKRWSDPIHKGTFKNGKGEKRILFDRPVKARYVRFTALSSQNGQDFASGSEFSLLAD